MKYVILQTNLVTKEERAVFSTDDQELMEMLYKDYVRQSGEDYAYTVTEKLAEN